MGASCSVALVRAMAPLCRVQPGLCHETDQRDDRSTVADDVPPRGRNRLAIATIDDNLITMSEHPKIAVIACRVMEDEVAHVADELAQVAAVHLLDQGLHNEPDKLQTELQKAVELAEQDEQIDAIALVYGLCSRGIEGVTARRVPLIIARAHDCITLLLGCRHRYDEYVKANPGTYWYSPGWNKCHVPPGKQRYDQLRAKYVEDYGEDNADFLMETEQQWFASYDRATYVHLSIGVTDDDIQYTRDCADWLGWNYDQQQGDTQLLYDLLTGASDDDRFCVARPGEQFRMTADHRIIETIQHTPADNQETTNE